MEHPAAPLLAKDLGRLPHTNANGELGYIQLPGFSTTGMGEEQSQATGTLALAVAEAAIESLDTHGYAVTPKTELTNLRKAAKPAQAPESIELTCHRCRRPIAKVNTTGQAKVNVKLLAAGLEAHRGCR